MSIKSICIFRTLIFYGVIFLAPASIAFPQNLKFINSVNLQPAFFSKANQVQISYQKPPRKFYIPDSIFSFRSQKGYVPSLIHNFKEQAVAPLKFNSKQWLVTGATISVTAALISLDDKIDHWARTQKEDHLWINKTSPVITELGGSVGVYSVIAFGLVSATFGKEKGVQTSLLASQAMITSGAWVQLIKQLTGRERPKASYIFSGQDGGKWHGPFEKYSQKAVDDRSRFSYDAFPSGHTVSVFSIATVFASQYNQTKVVPIVSYSVASLVGISRIIEHEHWASDVFVGALFGYICGKQVVRHYNKTQQSYPANMPLQSQNKPQITFFQDGNQIGLSVRW